MPQTRTAFTLLILAVSILGCPKHKRNAGCKTDSDCYAGYVCSTEGVCAAKTAVVCDADTPCASGQVCVWSYAQQAAVCAAGCGMAAAGDACTHASGRGVCVLVDGVQSGAALAPVGVCAACDCAPDHRCVAPATTVQVEDSADAVTCAPPTCEEANCSSDETCIQDSGGAFFCKAPCATCGIDETCALVYADQTQSDVASVCVACNPTCGQGGCVAADGPLYLDAVTTSCGGLVLPPMTLSSFELLASPDKTAAVQTSQTIVSLDIALSASAGPALAWQQQREDGPREALVSAWQPSAETFFEGSWGGLAAATIGSSTTALSGPRFASGAPWTAAWSSAAGAKERVAAATFRDELYWDDLGNPSGALAPEDANLSNPRLAPVSSSSWVVAWEQQQGEQVRIMAALVDANRTWSPLGDQVVAGTGIGLGSLVEMSVAIGAPNFVTTVLWRASEDDGIRVSRLILASVGQQAAWQDEQFDTQLIPAVTPSVDAAPALAVDANGNPWVVFVGTENNDSGVYVLHREGGSTWTPPPGAASAGVVRYVADPLSAPDILLTPSGRALVAWVWGDPEATSTVHVATLGPSASTWTGLTADDGASTMLGSPGSGLASSRLVAVGLGNSERLLCIAWLGLTGEPRAAHEIYAACAVIQDP